MGVAQGSPDDVMERLRANFEAECTEVGVAKRLKVPKAVLLSL